MNARFTPALRFDWLTGAYDFFLRLTFPERKIKQALIDQMLLSGSERILDFGCGTGTLSIMLKEQYPKVTVMGVDVDDKIIAIAEKKIKQRGLQISIQKYNGEDLSGFGNQQFDKIVSSLVFHHLPTNKKRTVLSQIYKLTKKEGELHIADFGKPKNNYTKIAFNLFRRFDGVENTAVNAEGLLPDFITDCGFPKVEILQSFPTAFGTIDLIKAFKS